MKVKNLNFAEKYLEKIVLAVAILFAGGVIWLKFLGDPYAVEMQGREMSPAEVEEQLLTAAEQLQSKVQSDKTTFEKPEIPKYSEQFSRRLNRSVARPAFRIALGAHGLQWDIEGGGGQPWYYVPPVPEPSNLRLTQDFGVLAEQRNMELANQFGQLIGSQRPWDLRWVSVSGTFDLDQWRQRLERQPSEPGYQKVTEDMWRDKLAIADVILERQMWHPERGENGEWGETQTLGPLPNNQWSWRNPPASWGRVEGQQVVQQINANQDDITKPPFPILAQGLWVRPDVDLSNLPREAQQRYRQLAEQIKQVQTRINELLQNPEAEAGGAPGQQGGPRRPGRGQQNDGRRRIGQPNPDQPGGPIPGEEGAIMPDGSGGGQDGQGGGVQSVTDIDALRNWLRDLRREQAVVAGVASEAYYGNVADPDQQDGRQERDFAQIPDRITVWGHDVTIEPGRSYRYRLIVSVINPLFQEASVPPDQQKKMYNQLAITSEPSEWSGYITIENDLEFFFVAANQQNHEAVVEVYTIFNGQRVMQQFEPQPGDPIGGIVTLRSGVFEVDRDLSIGAVLLDIDHDAPSSRGLSQTTSKVYFSDRETGDIFTRTVEQDSSNEYRLQMRNEAANRSVAQQQ